MSFIKDYRISIFKPSKYTNFHKKPIGKGIIYFLVLIFVFSIFPSTGFVLELEKIYNKQSKIFINNIKDFKIDKGKLVVDGKKPLILVENDLTLAIDTSGELDESFLDEYDDEYEHVIFITDEIIYMKSQILTLEKIEIKNILYTLNREEIIHNVKILKILLYILVFLFLPFTLLLMGFYNILMMTFIGKIMNTINHVSYSFKEVFNLGLYSATFPITVFSILAVFGIGIPYSGIITVVIGLIYLLFAFDSIEKSKNNKEQVH